MTAKLRKDSWTAEDDNLLKDIVIKNIEQGITQRAGFEEASALLGRSKQACAFRWNKYLRPLQLKRETSVVQTPVTEVSNSPSLPDHLQLAMESYEEMQHSYVQIAQEYNLLKRDYDILVNWIRQGTSHVK